MSARDRVEAFFFSPATPTNLGAIRVGVFSTMAVLAAREDVRADASNALINWRPTSFFRLLPGPPTAGVLRAIQIATVAAVALAAIGLFTRMSQLVATPLAAYLLGFDSNFGKINHRSMLLVLLGIALLPSGAGDGLSIDRLRRAARSRDGAPVSPDPRYRWPVALAQVTAVSVYLFAGLSKLWNGGPEWFTADAFRRFLFVRLDQLPNPPGAGLWLASHPGLAQATAIASVVFELSVVLVLVRPWLRRVMVPGLVAFHESTRLLTRIDFTRTLVAAVVPLLDYEGLGRRVRECLHLRRVALLIDGACPLCRRTSAVLQAGDVFRRLEILDARDEAALARFPTLEGAPVLDEMHLVLDDGRAVAGFGAFRRLSRMIPVAWPLALAFHAPGVRRIGSRIYRRVSRSRFPILHCTSDGCPINHGAGRPQRSGDPVT